MSTESIYKSISVKHRREHITLPSQFVKQMPLARWLMYTALLLVCFACNKKQSDPPLLELLSPNQTGITFSNTLYEDSKLNIITFEYLYNGAGVGVGDVNNDGLSDLFFTANMSSNKLYLNKGEFHFEDVTDRSGTSSKDTHDFKWATGVAMVDINQDGWLDIYVCYAGPFTDASRRANELYINKQDGTFTEQAHAYGLDDTSHSVQAAFFDYDRDGDLDMYLLTNITDETGPNIIRPKRLKGEMVNTDRLYRNNGNNTFTNVSKSAGITAEGYGLGVSVCDINSDGWMDVYVSNDYLSNDLMYVNNGDGTFTDRASVYFDHTSYSAMGNDVADFNNDGLLDIIAVDMLPPDNKRQKLMFGATNYDRYRSEIRMGYTPQFMRNTIQLGRGKYHGNPVFSEIGQLAGVSATDWSWSPLFADIDNDGWRDLIITNGYPRDITNRDFANYKASELTHQGYSEGVGTKLMDEINKLEGAQLPSFAFRNNGDLTFADSSSAWGFNTAGYSTGAAYVDLDNDGDLDFVTNNTNAPAYVYRNNSREFNKNHYLRLKFKGPVGNLHGIGAEVNVELATQTIYAQHGVIRGFQSTVEDVVHIGLGKDSLIVSVEIRWPDAKVQHLKNVHADQLLTINYYDAESPAVLNAVKSDRSLFEVVDTSLTYFRHRESHYADFKIQPLIPHKYSQQGPPLAVADVDRDGDEDVFVGGAFNQSGQLLTQKEENFVARKLSTLKKFEEDTGALFFDADQDGDEDLYIASGGNEFELGSPFYQDRLYVNDGNGNFAQNKDALPKEQASGGCVVAGDYDKDGDLDLFVGGRLTPQNYPKTGESMLLKNNKGKFEIVTDQIAPGLRDVGMVTSAIWTDYDNDNLVDLIVVGEWMPITIFKNSRGKLHRVNTRDLGLAQSSGWWNSINGSDIDNDGDIDYVLGNLGTNTRYQASLDNPVRAYVGDFNDDKLDEAILAYAVQGIEYPAHPRDDIFLRLPSFKKFFPTYATYADETMSQLMKRMPKTKIDTLQVYNMHSSILINNGKSAWTLKPLPIEAQFAPVYGTLVRDFNGDGNDDILAIGNSDAPDVLTGRYDALKGIFLNGNGTSEFTAVAMEASGIDITGDAKSIVEVHGDKRDIIFVGVNNGPLRQAHLRNQIKSQIARKNSNYALVKLKNGKTKRVEFYNGSGYLSQSTKRIHMSDSVISVEFK